MREVAIVGAGDLGGAVAHLLARADVVNAIRLVDETGSVAAGKALDIMQAAPIEQFTTRVTGTTDLFSIGGATVIVLADRVEKAEWQGEEGLQQLTRIRQIAPDRTILCAGGAQLDLIERAVTTVKVSRSRIFGSAPEALAGALRAFVALEANVSPADVSLMVLGRPPDFVVAWDQVTVSGRALTTLLDEPSRRRLASRVGLLWPPGPHALAASAVKAIACVVEDSPQMVTCFTAPASSEMRAVATPVRLGSSGLVEADTPWLSAHDQVALDNSRLKP